MGRCIGWGIIGTFALLAGLMSARAAENLLRNGSFEQESVDSVYTEARHWKYVDSDPHGDYWGSASRENWRAVDGEYIGSVRGLWADRGNCGGVWQEAPAEPGATYRFSGWFYCDPEWMARTQEIILEFWDANHTNIVASERRKIDGCDTDWTELSVEAAAPDGTSWVRVVINVVQIGAAGSLQFDDLALIKNNPHTEVLP